MGSRVNTVSTAIDNRLAVTDQGFGLSSSGSGNNTALSGDIFNLSAGGYGGGKGSTGGGGSINLTVTDNNAVNKALDFAGFSLSAMLDSIITGQKTQAAAAAYQADTIGQAVTQSAAQTAAATTAAVDEAKAAREKNIKLIIGAALLGGVFWYFKKGRT